MHMPISCFLSCKSPPSCLRYGCGVFTSGSVDSAMWFLREEKTGTLLHTRTAGVIFLAFARLQKHSELERVKEEREAERRTVDNLQKTLDRNQNDATKLWEQLKDLDELIRIKEEKKTNLQQFMLVNFI